MKQSEMLATSAEQPIGPLQSALDAVSLSSGGTVLVRSVDGASCVRVLLANGELTVECVAGRMRICASEGLELSAPSLVLRAEQELRLESAGDVEIAAQGELRVNGASMALTASRGDVSLYANDDVRIDGERIRMNA